MEPTWREPRGQAAWVSLVCTASPQVSFAGSRPPTREMCRKYIHTRKGSKQVGAAESSMPAVGLCPALVVSPSSWDGKGQA